MATKAGKVQVKDIRVGKIFYLVKADFPIMGATLVGEGEVESVRRIRVISRPFWRRLSATPAFRYIDDRGTEDWINLNDMALNHADQEIILEKPYFVVLSNRNAVRRFTTMFNDRKPTKKEVVRTLLREANLVNTQRSYA
jgi:hypothetical protein